MKNLKIKLGLFSVLAILAASIFLTSCEQDAIQIDQATNFHQIQEADKLVLPHGINGNQDLTIEYLNNATESQISTWRNNAEITERLASIGKLDEVNAALTMGQNISEFDLDKILSDDEIMNLYQYTPQIESRGCALHACYGAWSIWRCCKPPYGNCYYYTRLGC